jgi:predicted TIM-barrel fold metal-dependent hydrolase
MDAAGVDRVVIVPPMWEGERNDVALAAAQTYPDRFGVMGRLDQDTPDARERVSRWRDQPGMLGLRFSFFRPGSEKPLLDGRMDWVWREAERQEIPVMVLASHSQLHLIDSVAERHPGLRLVIDHLGLTDGKDDNAFRDLDRLLALSRRRNVAVKASALPFFTTDAYPFRNVHPYLRRVYDAFGPLRTFWGSDLSRLACGYKEAVTFFTDGIPWLTTQDKEQIMGRAICEWLQWEVPDDTRAPQ